MEDRLILIRTTKQKIIIVFVVSLSLEKMKMDEPVKCFTYFENNDVWVQSLPAHGRTLYILCMKGYTTFL